MAEMLRIAHIIARTEAEGPGVRTAIWTQGCTIRCPGCCNPELFGATGRREWTVDEVVAEVPADVAGITLLGGEPVEQAEGVTALALAIRARGQTVVLFSGFTREAIERRAPELLGVLDVLVDGPFVAGRPESGANEPRRWIGSQNQGLHFLSDRYGPSDFLGKNTMELRLSGGTVTVNGWPVSRGMGR